MLTTFLHDGVEEIADYDGGGTLLRRYVHGPGVDEYLVMYTGSGTTNKSYFHGNHQGSIIAMSDSAGNVIEQHSYDAYGNSDDLTGNPFRYTGRRLDEETGLYYYRARYYSPAIGRFLQTDPIGYGDGLNWYAYVGNDPMNKTDPSGNCPWCLGAIIGGGLEIARQAVTGELEFSASSLGKIAVASGAGALGGGIASGVAKLTASIGTRALANAGAGAVIGAGSTAATDKLNGKEITAESTLKGAAIGLVAGGLGSAAADKVAGGATQILANKTGNMIAKPSSIISGADNIVTPNSSATGVGIADGLGNFVSNSGTLASGDATSAGNASNSKGDQAGKNITIRDCTKPGSC